ncbi:hypothetical protein B0H19DRAFT_911617, partial [Mycena capillaripes]
RPDYALHSTGASVIPSLTSQTYTLRPSSLRRRIVGYFTGDGILIGRPPITALHYDIHDGHCWPFAGSQGQLGIVLAALVYIDHITIDHTLPKFPEYIRIASFRYDIHSRNNVQTFPVDAEIRSLGIDFGVVVLVINSNWGKDEYTCLYRIRVHGQQI